MRTLAIPIVIASVLTALVVERSVGVDLPAVAPADVQASSAAIEKPATQALVTAAGTVAIDRAADGHFYAEGTINGADLRFLVDTGASAVAIGRDDARRLGLFVSDADFTGSGLTANGPVKVAPVTIPRMTVGSITATDVRGAVVDVPTLPPLLGQSFLSQLHDVTIRNDRMELR